MNTVLFEENLVICVVYLDDVIVLGDSIEECWKNTIHVMKKLINAGFNISAKKCKFCITDILVLGHKYGKGRLVPNDKKLLEVDTNAIP